MARTRHTLVVVGASLAGVRAVEAVRNDGWDGAIVLIGSEPHLPYDRPPLSKSFLTDDPCPEDPTYRAAERLQGELAVDLRLGTMAEALDTQDHILSVNGEELRYDALVLATGSVARTLPGVEDLAGVFTLRSLDDAKALRSALRNGRPRVTVAGAGFIGSEVASAARALGLDVTLLERSAGILARAVGEGSGQSLAALHHRHGTRLLTGADIHRVHSTERQVSTVELTDGTRITTDVLVVGTGADPATSWLHGSGLTLRDGVVADATLRAAPDVYVAGDIARWPNPLFADLLDAGMRLQHWTSAAEQGARAARNAVAEPQQTRSHETVPYFWSDWYGTRIQFAGIPASDRHKTSTEVVAGDPESCRFTTLHQAGDRLIGVLTAGMPAEVMKYRRLIARRAPYKEALDLAAQRRAATSAA